MAEKPAFITLKDHKDNFNSNPKCRLINPSKTELGKVSKIILDDINNRLRSKLHVNQWQNSTSVIDWFNSISNKPSHVFLSFDIVEFYPSITESLLDEVVAWAKSLTNIPDDQVAVIKHNQTHRMNLAFMFWRKVVKILPVVIELPVCNVNF